MMTERTRSRLIERLRDVQRGPVAPIGFAAVPRTVPAMALLAQVPQATVDLVAAAGQAGADAVAIPAATGAASPEEERDRLIACQQATGGVPVGLVYGPAASLTVEDVHWLAGAGFDFLIVGVEQAPAPLVTVEGVGRLIRVEADLAPGLLRALGELEVDAVVLGRARLREDAVYLSLYDVLGMRQVADLVRQPVVVPTEQNLLPADLQALRQAGVLGLLLTPPLIGETPEAVRASVTRYRQAIAQIRPLRRRPREEAVVLPQVRAPAVEEEEEEEDE